MTKIGIIGGGPAGIISGLYFLEKGLTPTVYERQRKEDYKSTPCAEAISLRTLKKLRGDINFDSDPFIRNEVSGANFHFPRGKKARLDDGGAIINRTDWLKALAEEYEKRGGELRYGEEIKDPRKLEYEYLVGAEGPVSNTRKIVGGEVRIVVACQYRIKSADYRRDRLEFFIDKRFSDYYSWIFPWGEYLTVGCGGKIEDLDRFLRSRNLKGEVMKREIHQICFSGSKFQRGNVFLIGDAAGMANSITGAGLAPIVLASDILSNCFEEDDPDEYEEKVREVLIDGVVTDILLRLDQDYFRIIGNLVDGKDVGEFLKKREIFNLDLRSFLMFLRRPSFLVETYRIFRARKEIKRAAKLW